MAQKALKIHQIVYGGTTIKGIVNQNISPGIEQFLLQGGGSLDPFNAVTLRANESITFQTTDIAALLGAVSIDGEIVDGTPTLIIYFRQLADGGTYTGGANDMSYTVNKGKMFWTNISGNTFGQAVASVTVIPTYDGTNAPLVTSITATAPTLSRETDVFKMGTLSVNGTDIPVVGFNFDLNLKVEPVGSGGQPYNTEVFTTSRSPMFTFNVHNLNLSHSSGLAPLTGALPGGDVIFYLRKCAVGGTLVANGTASHIKFTMKDGQLYLDNISGATDGIATADLKVTPVSNGTDAIIAINTASAIT